MNRPMFVSRLMVAIIALAALFAISAAGSPKAMAQCCKYTVDIDCNNPPCLPLTIQTFWNLGGVTNSNHNNCGVKVVPVSFPCPPEQRFRYLNINGNPVQIVLNQPIDLVIGGCCFHVEVTLDAGGCIYVKIRKC